MINDEILEQYSNYLDKFVWYNEGDIMTLYKLGRTAGRDTYTVNRDIQDRKEMLK